MFKCNLRQRPESFRVFDFFVLTINNIKTHQKKCKINMKVEKEIIIKTCDEPKPVRGRQRFLEMYRELNPDVADELDDDTLYSFVDERYLDLDNRYKSLNGANRKLAQLISENPKLGAFLALISGESCKSVPYALANVFGKEVFQLDARGMEEFERGEEEYRKRYKAGLEEQRKAQENFKNYEKTLSAYGKENNLTEDQVYDIHRGVMDIAEELLMGNIPMNIIDLVYKGLNYDQDMQEAIDTGVVEGRNEVIKETLRSKRGNPDRMPDFGNTTGAGRSPKLPGRNKGSFYDSIEEVKI